MLNKELSVQECDATTAK